MKPRVFLSHAKTDRALIERLAADLRAARIEVWFDEWEIPTGTSLRQRVFNGIARCDVFFVYLTEASRGSTWVERELDAAFVKDHETDGGSVALFVDSDATRRELPLDLRSLRVPVMSNEDYARPLADLVSRVWEVHERRLLREHDAKAEENTRVIERNFAHVTNGLGRLIRMYNRPASFAWYEWHHRVTAVGDGAIRVRAGIRGDDPPRLWWRHTFGITPDSPGVHDNASLEFSAKDETTGKALDAVLFRDGPHDKDYVILFPQPVPSTETFALELSHVWPAAWQTLVKTRADSSWFSVERACPSVGFHVELPAGMEIESFTVSPPPPSALTTIGPGLLEWRCRDLEPGRYLWELRLR